MSRNLLKSSVENASFSIVFQVLFRCLTFVINAWVLRHVGHDVIGIMNVRLLLLESSILFLSREPFLRACLGHKNGPTWPQVINQMWLTLPVSVIFSFLFLYIWLHVLSLGHPEYKTQYAFGCWSVAISCVIELLSASVALVAQIFCFVKLRVALDTIHILVRTVIFLAILIYDTNKALIAFSLAQVFSAATVTVSYYVFFHWYIKKLNHYKEVNTDKTNLKFGKYFQYMEDFPFKSVKEFLPCKIRNADGSLDPKLCTLTISFAKQGFVKQILTEGEKYVMSVSPVLSLSEQATYDVVNNLGSLAARFIFRPIEESGYFYFTQMIDRNTEIKGQDKNKVSESCIVLCQLCKIVTSIGLIVLVFGQSYARTLLLLYGGEGFVGSGLPVLLMRCHCLAVILLAINGVTECYSFATMTNNQLDRYNYLMVFFSVSFLVLSYVLTNLFGPVGFILSNCINMLARIFHSTYFIKNKFKSTSYKPLDGLMIGKVFGGALLAAGLICKVSEIRISPYSQIIHVVCGSVVLVLVMSAWAYENWQLLEFVYNKYVKKIGDHQKPKEE